MCKKVQLPLPYIPESKEERGGGERKASFVFLKTPLIQRKNDKAPIYIYFTQKTKKTKKPKPNLNKEKIWNQRNNKNQIPLNKTD